MKTLKTAAPRWQTYTKSGAAESSSKKIHPNEGRMPGAVDENIENGGLYIAAGEIRRSSAKRNAADRKTMNASSLSSP